MACAPSALRTGKHCYHNHMALVKLHATHMYMPHVSSDYDGLTRVTQIAGLQTLAVSLQANRG